MGDRGRRPSLGGRGVIWSGVHELRVHSPDVIRGKVHGVGCEAAGRACMGVNTPIT